MAAPTNAAFVKKVLANSEPSTHGPSRQFAPTQQFGRFRCEVDMRRKPIAGGLTARFLKQISIGSRFNGKLDEYRGDGLYC
jgi:hypothetical protein